MQTVNLIICAKSYWILHQLNPKPKSQSKNKWTSNYATNEDSMIDFWSVSTKGDDSVRVWSHLNQFKLFCKQYPWVLWHKNKHTDTVNGLTLWFSWEGKFAYFIIKKHYMAILQTASKLACMRTQLVSYFSSYFTSNYIQLLTEYCCCTQV